MFAVSGVGLCAVNLYFPGRNIIIVSANAQTSDKVSPGDLLPTNFPTDVKWLTNEEPSVAIFRIIGVSMSVLGILSLVGTILGIIYLVKSKIGKAKNMTADEFQKKKARNKKIGVALLVSSICILILLSLVYVVYSFAGPDLVSATTGSTGIR